MVSHRLLQHVPKHVQQQLYNAILDVWRGNRIPTAWLRSRVVLIYQKKDPQDLRNTAPCMYPPPSMAQWDDILLLYLKDTLGIQKHMNRHHLTTGLREGGLRLRHLWWSYITR